MCGIFGWSRKPWSKRNLRRMERLADTLAVANDWRGGHSWGVCADGATSKALGRMGDYLKIPPSLAPCCTVLAHTRFATHGEVTIQNAHPFRIGGLIGSHNGIVFNHDALNLRYGRKCQVDSMHFFHHIARGLPLEEIEAYGTVQWVESRFPQTAYLATFNGGDLAVVRTSVGLIWSSDDGDLIDACEEARLDYRLVPTDPSTLYRIADGRIAAIDSFPIGGRPKPARRWSDYAFPPSDSVEACGY